MSKIAITLTVNGKPRELNVELRDSLAEALRRELDLTGTHLGCEHGVCGACTVLYNGETIRGCLMFAVQAQGAAITTIEGVSPPTGLSPLQESFRRNHALQCGFCTPGMVLSLHRLFTANPVPDKDEIVEALSGNLCRCTGYQAIVAAGLDLAEQNRKAEAASSPNPSTRR